MIEIKVNPKLEADYRAAVEAEREAREALCSDARKQMGLESGQLVQTTDGKLYRVDDASVSLGRWGTGRGELVVSVRCNRVYKTGRRDARSSTWFGPGSLSPYVPPVDDSQEKLRKQRERAAARLAALDAQLDKGSATD